MTLDTDDVTIEMDLTVERGRLPGRRARRGAPDRGHRRRRDLHSGPQDQLLGREHARRSDDQLRQAHDRDRDRRDHHAGGGAPPLRRDPGQPVPPVRDRRHGRHPATAATGTAALPANMLDMPIEELDLRCGPTTRSSATTSSRSASCFSSRTTTSSDAQLRQEVARRDEGALRMRGFIVPETEGDKAPRMSRATSRSTTRRRADRWRRTASAAAS